MPHLATLSDGTESFNFYNYDAGGFANGGHDMGIPGASPRVLKVEMKLFSTSSVLTVTQLETNINRIRRLLAKAARTTAAGNPRQVVFSIQPDGAAVATTYYVQGGGVEPRAPWNHQYNTAHVYDDLELTLLVEPWGYGPETQLSTGVAIYGRPGIDARFVATGASGTGVIGTPAGANTAALVSGSLAQNNKLTISPTLTTMANQVAFYFGCSFGAFGDLVLGIETAKTGTWSGVWEIMTGAATFTAITTTSTLRSGAESTEFDTVRRVGSVILTGSTAGWSAQAVGGITAFWLRYRITAFTSGLAPVFIGPIRSAAGMVALASAVVPGDGSAAGLVHVVNPGATALAGMKLAVATGEIAASAYAPAFVVDLAGANKYIPTGETTAAVTTDSGAVDGERVDLTVLATITDRSQTFNGTSEYVTVTPVAADKLYTLTPNGFIIAVLFKADVVTQSPTCLDSQWTGTLATSSYWLGIDQGKLRFMVVNDDGDLAWVNGTTNIVAGEWILATGEYNNSDNAIAIYKNAQFENFTANVFGIQGSLTTAMRCAKSVGYTASHSLTGAAEVYFDGLIANVQRIGTTIEEEYSQGYTWPSVSVLADSGSTRWLAKMDDNAASLVIVDSAVTFAVAKNGARSATNTNAATNIGYFAAGVGAPVRALGTDLPRHWAEEFRGRCRILLRATPSATLLTLDDIIFQLQLNVGDGALPLGIPGRFPAIPVPASGYYLIDLGIWTLPPVALRHGGPLAALTSAKNVLEANIWITHKFIAATAIRLDCLYLLPTRDWYGEFSTFRPGAEYQTAYAIDQNKGVLFDSLSPETVIYQSSTSGYTDPAPRNPYADVGGADRVSLVSQMPTWLFGIPLRGIDAATGDYLVHVLADSLTPEIRAVGQYDVLALS
jgi:hypothetical protein